jgi:hypothetical protein
MLQPLYSLVEAALRVAYEHVFTIQVDDYIDMAVQFLRPIMPIVKNLQLCDSTMRYVSSSFYCVVLKIFHGLITPSLT